MSDLDTIRESIGLALNPPAPEGASPTHRLVRRLTVRLGRAHARHQQETDLQFLAAIASLQTHVADTVRALQDQIQALERRLQPLEALASTIREPPNHAALGFERFDAGPAGSVLGYRQPASPVSPSQDYLAFENVFRLSEDVIRDRQRPYISLLGGREPVLDAGCGRGEFLELLRETGIPALGVDLDPGMVARARAKDLEVHEGDVVSYIEGLADGSLGVVFSAQVVEHLPYPRLLAFLRLAHQKLKPGGLMIAETVNPHVPMAFKNFWLDLTHQHPVFPEVLLTMCRGIGFGSAYIFHPGGTGDFGADREWCGDYAVVAERAGVAAPSDPSAG